MLLGSSLLPAMIWIGEKQVQLGDVVCKAFEKTGLTASEWNALEPLKREGLLAETVYALRAVA